MRRSDDPGPLEPLDPATGEPVTEAHSPAGAAPGLRAWLRRISWRPILGALFVVVLLTTLAGGGYAAVTVTGLRRLEAAWAQALATHRSAADAVAAVRNLATPVDVEQIDTAVAEAEADLARRLERLLASARSVPAVDPGVRKLRATVVAALARQVAAGPRLVEGRQGWVGGTEASAALVEQRRRFRLGPGDHPPSAAPPSVVALHGRLESQVFTGSAPEHPLWLLTEEGAVLWFQGGRVEEVAGPGTVPNLRGGGWMARAGDTLWASSWNDTVRMGPDGSGVEPEPATTVLPVAGRNQAWLAVPYGEGGSRAHLEPGGPTILLEPWEHPTAALDDHLVVQSHQHEPGRTSVLDVDGRRVAELGAEGYVVAARGRRLAWAASDGHVTIRHLLDGAETTHHVGDDRALGRGAFSTDGTLALPIGVEIPEHEDVRPADLLVIGPDGAELRYPELARGWYDPPPHLSWWGDRHLVWIEPGPYSGPPGSAAQVRYVVGVAEVRTATDGSFVQPPDISYLRLRASVVAFTP